MWAEEDIKLNFNCTIYTELIVDILITSILYNTVLNSYIISARICTCVIITSHCGYILSSRCTMHDIDMLRLTGIRGLTVAIFGI